MADMEADRYSPSGVLTIDVLPYYYAHRRKSEPATGLRKTQLSVVIQCIELMIL